MGAAALAGLVAALILIGWVTGPARPRRLTAPTRGQATDEPVGTPYRVFTRDFDCAVAARDAPALLAEADRHLPPGQPPHITGWPARISAAERWVTDHHATISDATARLQPALAAARGRAAILVLIDQSGSMRDRVIAVAATIRWLSGLAGEARVPLAIAGFTSLGWRGGRARRAWEHAGRPVRPGRFCALLHLHYQRLEGPLEDSDWRAMLHPDLLPEIVDGEALAWAADLLAERPESTKVLIVLSDGAPVDDSTLMENGPNYLMRHLRDVVAELGHRGIRLGAVGIEHAVVSLYPAGATAFSLLDLPAVLAAQIATAAG